MKRLGDTVRDIAAFRARLATQASPSPTPHGGGKLKTVALDGPNPGNLRMHVFLPPDTPAKMPLVVVLHGCTQSAARFDVGAGWSALAQAHGFALLYPEQKRANNPNLCFNWFATSDVTRGSGEVESIHAMIQQMIAADNIDPRQVYITGLSAGGAMASAMLATYPEVFAAGAIIAGLAYGAAASVRAAFESMSGGPDLPARQWGDKVRSASPHAGPWPHITVWQGDADATVRPVNAVQIVAQWLDVLGLPPAAAAQTTTGRLTRSVWSDARTGAQVELCSIAGMGHGVPLDVQSGIAASGLASPYFLDVGIASTRMTATAWGLCDKPLQRCDELTDTAPANVSIIEPHFAEAEITSPAWNKFDSVQSVIHRALAAAGLMK